MACDFRQVPIRDLVVHGVVKLQTGPFGSQLHKHEYVGAGAGVPVIPTEGIGRGRIRADVALPHVSVEKAAELHRHRLREGDILFARRGIQATGLSACIDSDHVGSLCGTGAILLRVDKTSIHPRFLAAFLATDAAFNWLRSHAVGAVMPNLNTEIISDLVIPFPPMQTQIDIGNFVAALDDRIDLLRQTNTTLEVIAQALFKSWFVDFYPVHAKHALSKVEGAEGREPEGMDAATAALFPSEFEESELGLIPKGWRVDGIGNAVKCLGGGTPSTKDEAYWTDGEFHWVTPKDLSGMQAPVLTTTGRKVTEAGLSRISSGLLPIGTLLMSSRAPIGYLALAGIPTAINQGFIAMPPGGTLPPLYLFFWTQTNMDSIKQKANGSTFMEISKSAFRPIKLCVPPPELVDAFVAIVSPLMSRIEASEHHRVALTDVRDTLLPRLISGKLRLPEAESAIEDAMA